MLRHRDSSLLLMSGSVTGTWNSAGRKGIGDPGQGPGRDPACLLCWENHLKNAPGVSPRLPEKLSSARDTHKSSHHPLLSIKDESGGVQVLVRDVRDSWIKNPTQGGGSPGHLLGMDAVRAGRVSAWTWDGSTDQQSHCLPSLGPAWLPLSRPRHRCHIPEGLSTKKGTHTRSLEFSNTPVLTSVAANFPHPAAKPANTACATVLDGISSFPVAHRNMG